MYTFESNAYDGIQSGERKWWTINENERSTHGNDNGLKNQRREGKKCKMYDGWRATGKIYAYIFWYLKKTEQKKEVASLCWLDFGPANASDGSLFKQCSCKWVCVRFRVYD